MGDPNNTGWFRLDRESAAKALETAGPNRTGYEADRKDYASAMRNGKWEDYSGNPFYCDVRGRLRRGSHRAHAVIMADAEIIVEVRCGASERQIEVDDAGHGWTTHCHMTQKTGKSTKSIAETVFNTLFILGLKPQMKKRDKHAACGEFYDLHAEAFSKIEEKLAAIPDKITRKSLRLAAIAAAFFELYNARPDLFDEVMDALVDISTGPAKNFRRLIDKCFHRGGGGPAMKDHYAWAKYAIVKFVAGEDVSSSENWAKDSSLATMSPHKARSAGRRARRPQGDDLRSHARGR